MKIDLTYSQIDASLTKAATNAQFNQFCLDKIAEVKESIPVFQEFNLELVDELFVNENKDKIDSAKETIAGIDNIKVWIMSFYSTFEVIDGNNSLVPLDTYIENKLIDVKNVNEVILISPFCDNIEYFESIQMQAASEIIPPELMQQLQEFLSEKLGTDLEPNIAEAFEMIEKTLANK